LFEMKRSTGSVQGRQNGLIHWKL